MIKLDNVRVELGDFNLRDVSLTINEGEYFIILGPTGAGKTVLLESIAGLHQVKEGNINLRGHDITAMEPEKRGISIVYQDCALFPHLSVRDNIVFGLKLRDKTRLEISNDQEWITGLLGISHLLHRKPETLSGGEMQKVAIARALITRPNVLLLDEPLGALDPQTREQMQDELRKLHITPGITTIHVTHDFEEAMSLGTRIAVIGDGQVKQIGTPDEIFRHPNSEFVARFAMTRNIFQGEIVQKDNGKKYFRTGNLDFEIAGEHEAFQHASVRPEDISISLTPAHPDEGNYFSGTITQISDRGSVLYITVNLPPDVVCLVTRNVFESLKLTLGQKIYIGFQKSAVHIFE